MFDSDFGQTLTSKENFAMKRAQQPTPSIESTSPGKPVTASDLKRQVALTVMATVAVKQNFILTSQAIL